MKKTSIELTKVELDTLFLAIAMSHNCLTQDKDTKRILRKLEKINKKLRISSGIRKD